MGGDIFLDSNAIRIDKASWCHRLCAGDAAAAGQPRRRLAGSRPFPLRSAAQSRRLRCAPAALCAPTGNRRDRVHSTLTDNGSYDRKIAVTL